jgi:pentatricopeptide repeat protein
MLLSCRAACSLLKVRAAHLVFNVARALSVESREPDDSTSDFGARPVQRSSGSSKLGSSKRGSSAHRATRVSQAERSAIQKSQALTARIGLLGRQGRWQDVVRALETAESSGQKLYVNNFSAAIAALTRSKQPGRALQLLPLMQQRDIQPDGFTYTSSIDACSKSGQWQKALKLPQQMQQHGVVPDAPVIPQQLMPAAKVGSGRMLLKF